MTSATISFVKEVLPPHHASHGTNHAMVRRTVQFDLPSGTSTWEQTDYGHPGRFNAWEPRRIATRLQTQTERLKEIAELVSETADE